MYARAALIDLKTKVAELSKRLRSVEGGESQKELRHLRRKCVRLEEENERLTRKLEYVSNNAAVGNGGGASPPRTPPDLNLPKLQPRRGAAQINDANKARLDMLLCIISPRDCQVYSLHMMLSIMASAVL